MKFFEKLRGKKFEDVFDKSSASSIDNPYVAEFAGRKIWNDRYLNMAKATRNWQLAFIIAISIVALQTGGLIYVATQSKIQPFVVETNQGMPYAVKAMSTLSLHDQKLINYAVNQFVINAKTIVGDTHLQKTILNKVYAYSADNTLNYLHDFYLKNNPFEIAAKFTTTLKIVNSLPTGHNTWEVVWDETKHDPSSGSTLGTERWMAHITYKFGEVNEKMLNDNPFGFYITDISWSQSST